MLASRAKRRWFKVRTEEKTIGEFTDAAGAARLGMAAHLRAVTAGRRAETDVAVLDANRLHTVAQGLAVSVSAFAPAFGASCAGRSVVPLTAYRVR